MFQENMLCLNAEIIEGQDEICSNDREILQKTGTNELSDQCPFITEVDNHFIGEDNEEATGQWLKDDDDEIWMVRFQYFHLLLLAAYSAYSPRRVKYFNKGCMNFQHTVPTWNCTFHLHREMKSTVLFYGS
jgi:hypothetical protein